MRAAPIYGIKSHDGGAGLLSILGCRCPAPRAGEAWQGRNQRQEKSKPQKRNGLADRRVQSTAIMQDFGTWYGPERVIRGLPYAYGTGVQVLYST